MSLERTIIAATLITIALAATAGWRIEEFRQRKQRKGRKL